MKAESRILTCFYKHPLSLSVEGGKGSEEVVKKRGKTLKIHFNIDKEVWKKY